MGAHPLRIRSGCVIPDEYYAVEGSINSCHHSQVPGEGTNQSDVLGQLLNERILAVPMGIAYHDVRSARVKSSLAGRVHFVGHEFAIPVVLEALWRELVCSHYPDHAFHIGRYVDLELPRLRAWRRREHRRHYCGGYHSQDPGTIVHRHSLFRLFGDLDNSF